MKSDTAYLRHILDAIDRIEQYVAVGHDRFLAETQWQDAVIRQLQVIGEATKRLSPVLRERYAAVPWRRIAGMRDVLVHDYVDVDLEAVWMVTQKEVPRLRDTVAAALADLGEQ